MKFRYFMVHVFVLLWTPKTQGRDPGSGGCRSFFSYSARRLNSTNSEAEAIAAEASNQMRYFLLIFEFLKKIKNEHLNFKHLL